MYHLFGRSSLPRTLRRAVKPIVYFHYRLTARLRLLPDFLIIGAQRSGTTYLYNNLCMHPCIAPALTKEVHFFDVRFAQGADFYRGFFPLRLWKDIKQLYHQPLLTGEASPYYLIHPHVPRRIAKMLPQVKLIVLLRNPVDRAYSHYHHERRKGVETLSFEDAIEYEATRLVGEEQRLQYDEQYNSYNHQHYSYLTRGMYIDQLVRWLHVFPRDQLLIVQSEQLYIEPAIVLRQVFEYLCLPAWQWKAFHRPTAPDYPAMSSETRDQLLAFFRPYNQRLYDYLSTPFDWET
jgi:hypothetical protein